MGAKHRLELAPGGAARTKGQVDSPGLQLPNVWVPHEYPWFAQLFSNSGQGNVTVRSAGEPAPDIHGLAPAAAGLTVAGIMALLGAQEGAQVRRRGQSPRRPLALRPVSVNRWLRQQTGGAAPQAQAHRTPIDTSLHQEARPEGSSRESSDRSNGAAGNDGNQNGTTTDRRGRVAQPGSIHRGCRLG